MSDLRINISGLSGGVHHYSLRSPAKELDLDEKFLADVVVSVELNKTTREIALRASVTATAVFSCDRCLDQYQEQITTQYTMLYVLNGGSSEDEEDESTEVQVLRPDDNIIDIGGDVREYVTLAVPVKLLCREDCKGLCQTCGANLNHTQCDCAGETIDPRWAPLQRLSKR